jgi:competence ComEA-like helix-hairpin-helix protein
VNSRERAVVLFLAVAFAVGAAVAGLRGLQRNRQRAGVYAPVVDSAALVVDTTPAGPLDLNTATAAGLEALPGIGPVLAGRILDYRERHGRFRSVAELRRVSGIGPKRYAALCELVVVGKDSL